MGNIHVDLGPDSYDIVLRRGSLKDVGSELNLDRKVLVVTDSGVPREYAETVLKQCRQGHLFVFESGEERKNLRTFEEILRSLLEHSFSRKDCVVAIGGGIVGDMGSFAASCYMRGIDSYIIPTTVLSQVDSSIGGKTAVNLDSVKNVVGAFSQPKKVLIDPNVLDSLPRRQVSNGLSEALKMSATFDAELFNMFLEEDPYEQIDMIIEKSIICKRNVVQEDEKEMGVRKVLNFGHTIGHGIESTLLDGTLYHGECVALGMIPMCAPHVRTKLVKCLRKLELPTFFSFDVDAVSQAIRHDKKSNRDGISTIFVPEIGTYQILEQSIEDIREMLDMIRV